MMHFWELTYYYLKYSTSKMSVMLSSGDDFNDLPDDQGSVLFRLLCNPNDVPLERLSTDTLQVPLLLFFSLPFFQSSQGVIITTIIVFSSTVQVSPPLSFFQNSSGVTTIILFQKTVQVSPPTSFFLSSTGVTTIIVLKKQYRCHHHHYHHHDHWLYTCSDCLSSF